VPEWKSLLLDLVEKNEIDPWNVDIVRLTSLYLEEIRRRRDLDLYVPANAVLASSILLWLKSKVLRRMKEDLEEPEEEEVVDLVVEEPEELPLVLEPPEVTVVPPSRITQRRITLDELLDVMEKLMKKGVKKKTVEVVLPDVEEFFEEMEKGEDVEDYVEEVKRRLLEAADSTGMVLLSSFAPRDPLEFVKTLLALLYLASEGFVELFQEQVFGEVIVKVVERDQRAGSPAVPHAQAPQGG